MEIDFFKGALLRVEEKRRKREQTSGTPYEQIRQVDGQQGELTIERMCTLASVNRASFYRFCGPQPNSDEAESQLRDAIQRIALRANQLWA
jgi:hypothetical protein